MMVAFVLIRVLVRMLVGSFVFVVHFWHVVGGNLLVVTIIRIPIVLTRLVMMMLFVLVRMLARSFVARG
jgi:hypothetical protein